MFAFILAAALLGQCEPGDTPPLVEESVDEIALVYSTEWEFPTVVFIKQGKVLTTRAHQDEMLLLVVGDKFALRFQDYWVAERIVWTKRIGVYELTPETNPETGLEWWAAARVMTDLRAP